MYIMCTYIYMYKASFSSHYRRGRFCLFFSSRSLEQWGSRPNEACAPPSPPPLRSRPVQCSCIISNIIYAYVRRRRCVFFFLLRLPLKRNGSAGRSMSHSIKIMPQRRYTYVYSHPAYKIVPAVYKYDRLYI